MKRPIKILRIQSRICIGGPAIHTALLAEHLPVDEFRTVLIGGAVEADEFSRYEELKKRGIDIRILKDMQRSTNPFKDIKALYQLYKIIRREKPDIVHTHTAKAGALGRTAAILSGVPLIFHTFHGHTFEGYFPFFITQIYKFIERFLARFSTAIIAISPRQKYDLSHKHHIISAKQIHVIRLGFDLAPFFSVRKNGLLKKKLGLDAKHTLIGFIGRLVPIKNIPGALMILKSLHERGAICHLCIVGDGPERVRAERLTEKLGLRGYVHFLGWEQEIAQIYAGIDVLLLTSLNEGTPVAIIEAMATMTPTVASSVGGVPDLIVSGKNGFLYPLTDSEKAVDQVQRIIQDLSTLEGLTLAGNLFVKDNYLYTRLVRDIVRLYKMHLPAHLRMD